MLSPGYTQALGRPEGSLQGPCLLLQ